MKQLTLLRHAHAGWPESQSRDFDRPLDDAGHRGLAIIAPVLARLVRDADLVLCSPAVRAVQSYQGLAQNIPLPPAHPEPRLYMASLDVLLDVLHEQHADVRHILMVGHNPGLQDLAALFATSQAGTRIAHHFPTCAFAQFESDAPWSAWETGQVQLRAHNWPQNIDPHCEADQ